MGKYSFSDMEQKRLEQMPVPMAVYQFLNEKVHTLSLTEGYCRLFDFPDHHTAYQYIAEDAFCNTHPDDIARIKDAAYRFAKEGGRYEVIFRSMKYNGGALLGSTTLTSGEVTTAEGAENVTLVTGMVIALGVFTVLSGIVDILLGVFSVRASGDSTKIGPAYVLSIIALVLSILSVVLNFSEFNLSSLISALPNIVFSVVIFLAARTIKQSVA